MATGQEKLYVSQNGGGKATVTAQEVADLASGGGGSLIELSDVTIGLAGPLAPSQVLLCLQADPTDVWTNVDFNTLVGNALSGIFSQYPGFAAGQVLAVNATADGFEWVAP